VQSGHLHAVRGRGGGTFVADAPPPAEAPSPALVAGWRDVCDRRVAAELGVALLAAERAAPEVIAGLDELVRRMQGCLDDFPAYRRADVRFHVALAEATGSAGLVTATTEAQGAMSDLIHHIAHPPEVLAWSNAQHSQLVACVERRDPDGAVRVMTAHLRGTEHVLAGLLPGDG
jgi:GntR family transcriptional repressor for pyruvate dehydrogenase complex